ncbi:MAG TPA: AsmA family protein [Xanthobacteraceae bacterium]
MIAAIGIKRLGLAAAALVAGGLAALVILSLLIPADTVRDQVKTEIRAVTGLDPVLRGDVAVSLFPSGTVVFDQVALGDNRAGEPAMTVEQLVVRLRFFPLMIGRIEIADVSLVRPTITISFAPDGSSNWSSHIDMLARALRPNPDQSADRMVSFSEIRIGDGKVILRNDARQITETLTNVEFALAWPSISKTFAATGRFMWHDEVVEGAFSLSDFVSALVGERSGLKVRFSGAPVKFAFDGYISHRPTLRMEGTLAADGPSLRDTLRWTTHRAPPGGGFGRFSLKAQTNVVGGNVELSGLNVELDGNVGEGALTFVTDGRQSVQGTLAADGLDLTPYISAIRLLTSGDRSWERVPITLDGLNDADVDLRLSAARVTLATARLGRTAVAVNLRDGRFAVTVGESEAFGGVVKGSFGLAQSPAGAALKAQLQFTDVDLDQCLGELFGTRRIEGKGNLGFAVDSKGDSVYGLTKMLNGSASLTSRKGAIAGLNVEQLLKRLAKSPLSGGNELRSGKTPFSLLAASVKIDQGTIKVEDVRIEGPSLRLSLAGSASIPARDLDLNGTASLLAGAASGAAEAAPPAFELPFMVRGPWDDPLLLPDVQVLMKRSDAGSRLLESIQNRAATAPAPEDDDCQDRARLATVDHCSPQPGR